MQVGYQHEGSRPPGIAAIAGGAETRVLVSDDEIKQRLASIAQTSHVPTEGNDALADIGLV